MAKRKTATKARAVADELKAADGLADAIQQLRTALDGPTKEFGIALFAAFDSADAYRRVRGETTPAPEPSGVD